MPTTEPRRGLFLNFEGTDGCGKTTQLRVLAQRLRDEGRQVIETAEPGGTRIGRQIRAILLDSANQELCSRAEVLLYFASRAQNVEECIQPALAEGKVVLTDRFTDASMAYQGYGRGLGPDTIRTLDTIACQGIVPDLTLIFDIDLETSLNRAKARNQTVSDKDETRIDEEAVDFHARVRAAYAKMAAEEPQRFRVIDGRQDIQTIAGRVWEVVASLLR